MVAAIGIAAARPVLAQEAAQDTAKEATAPGGDRATSAAGTGKPVEGPALPPPVPPPPPPATAEEVAELRKQLAAVRETAAATQSALEMAAAELGAEREQRADEIISLQEKLDKVHAGILSSLRFTGYLQADWGVLNQASHDDLNPSNGNLLNEQRFLIRRSRLRASLDREYAEGVLELDGNTVNGTTARLVDAEASVKVPSSEPNGPPLAMLTVGLFKIPFGFEVLQSDRDRLFMERSTAERALFPGEFDLGIRLAGGWRFLRYAVAVQNGEPLGERTWPGRDPNAAKDVSGRLGIETPITDTVWIAAGFSGLSGKGFHAGTPATKTTVQWNDRNQNGIVDPGEITALPGMAAQPSANFTRFGYGADLRLGIITPTLGVTTLYGELYIAQDLDRGILPADPFGPLSRDLREIGGYVAFTQSLGSHFAAGVRYDFYNPDRDSSDPARLLVPSSFSYETIAGVVAANVGNVRLSVEYDRNRNHLGRDLAGNPTNLKSDTVLLRGQAGF